MNRKKVTLLAAIIGVFVIASGSIDGGTSSGGQPPVTFEKDVAPILESKCQRCHHPGGAAPMSLVSYAETRPWARALKEKAVTRTMPPFYAAGPPGYYEDDIRLKQEEIDTIARWVDSGSPRGKASNDPGKRDWLADKEEKPDLVLKPPKPYTVRKDGADVWELFAFDYVFPQDTWIRGIAIRPGNKSAVHHVALYILPDTMKPGPDGRVEGAGADTLIMGGQVILFWNPGGLPRMFKDGGAMVLPKGARLGIQVHYAPTTADDVVDQTSVGLYYANGVVNKMIRVLYGGRSKKIEIPAGEKHYELIDYKKFQTDAVISAFSAHMHLRGKSFKISLIYPDGKKETVFELPQFYFNWQRSYALAKKLTVPKGTVAEYIAVWDNSPQNPYNPDPTRVVRFGFNTTDEMMGGTIIYVIPQEELGFKVKDGVKIAEEKSSTVVQKSS